MSQQNTQLQSGLRTLSRVVRGIPATDGAGVQLTRVIGSPELNMLDPFLLLDVFGSDEPAAYIAGFPPHPHRGFETVTYLDAGRMRHKDSAGHEGVIEPGGVQWMTAGRGVVHSEMPEQEDGLLAGFQLWVNLPSEHKMDAPAYQEFDAGRIPAEQREGGTVVKVIAGSTALGTRGPVHQPLTEPRYFDVNLPADQSFEETVPKGHNAFVYVISGELRLPAVDGDEAVVSATDLAVLSAGDQVSVRAGDTDARFLFVSGRPLEEPVARGGPFVMNTRTEIEQAFDDYKSGRIG